MAEALYLLTKSPAAGGTQTINGIRTVLINADDAQTDAQIKALAVARLNAHFDPGPAMTPYNGAYFDTVTKVSDLTAGPLKDNGDLYAFPPDEVPIKIEGA